MKNFLIVIIGIIAILAIYSVITGRITDSRISNQVEHWKSVLDAEIPIGTSKEKVEEWGKKRHISNSWELIPGKNFFNANVAQVPDAGIGFPCSQWNTIIEVYIGADGKSNKREVYSVGSCI